MACRVWGGDRWAWRAWLSSPSDGTHSLCWFQWHLLHVWATVQTNGRQWRGYQPCGLVYACALWMAPVSSLVSNTTLGPGHLGPIVGSMSLLCPAPSSWPHSGSLDPGKMAITPLFFLVNSTRVTFLLLYMRVWKPDQHIEHCLPRKWACHKELVGWWGGKASGWEGISHFHTDSLTEQWWTGALEMLSSCQYLRSLGISMLFSKQFFDCRY